MNAQNQNLGAQSVNSRVRVPRNEELEEESKREGREIVEHRSQGGLISYSGLNSLTNGNPSLNNIGFI